MSGNAVNKLLKEIKSMLNKIPHCLWHAAEVRIRRRLQTHYGSLKMNAAIK